MKKFSKVAAMVLAAAMLATSLFGCSSSNAASSSSAPAQASSAAESVASEAPAASSTATTAAYAKTEYNLVFIPKLVHEWYEDVKKGIDKAVAELKTQGVTVNYTWDAPAQAVVTDQIAKIESAAAKKPDGISIAVIDAAATTTVINDMVKAGIKMSTFDCDAKDSQRLYYCGHSKNYEDGLEMANRLAKQLNEEGEVAVLAGTLSAINHQERVKGFKDGIAKYPKMKIVDSQADEDSIETSISVTEGYLTAYPNLKAIFGCNAASPIGAARAVKDANKVGKILIVGMAENQEAMNFVKDGTIFCTLKQDVPTYGYNSVYNMLLIADGKAPKTVVDEIPAIFVTKENVDQYITK